MLETLKSNVYTSEPFVRLEGELRTFQPSSVITLSGISGSLMAFVTSFVYEQTGKQILLIVPERDQAEKLRDDCSLLVSNADTLLFSHSALPSTAVIDVSAPLSEIESLTALSRNNNVLVVASVESIAVHLPQPQWFSSRSFQLNINSEYPFIFLLERLTELGFERKNFIEHYGDFAVRGGIVDVFPFVGDNPVRIEFWGDKVESIREFDILSQRSIRELQSAVIVPTLSGIETSSERGTASIFDYLKSDAVIIMDEPLLCAKVSEGREKESSNAYIKWDELQSRIDAFGRIYHTLLHSPSSEKVIPFDSTSQPSLGGRIKLLVERLEELKKEGYSLLLTCDTKDEARRLKELLDEEQNMRREEALLGELNEMPMQDISVSILNEALHSGFIFRSARLALFTEHEIFGRLKRRGGKRRGRIKGITARELSQLKHGDYVVHVDFGIGVYSGLKKIVVGGGEQEVMKIQYAENDTLYVNLNYVNRVQKYSSKEGHIPKLTRLGTQQWERITSKAKSRIRDIARDLINLYAKRKLEQCIAFSADTHWQKELEASFMFEDTPDQEKATFDVKQDMEHPSPMDRLICGDVGFGKTEVAVRAAFKSVMDGRQVAVLVPTTILAYQHLQTFSDRLAHYAVNIEMLSRFKTRREAATIIEGLKSGQVDIVIGTHRLLSKDVKFKDLGLLIIDEEHRFGVASKEKLRSLKASADTLTMTATPIPRTLQFSLLGARDLSLINTPPNNRLPIETDIVQFDKKLIRGAILAELHRGGQAYFIHDRIENIDDVRLMLEDIVPEAKFHIAHGQMLGHELEKTMMSFLEKKYDVLICTKIIESGIDIPSVNTIIINHAERFGLAELYQLRGRVGRSNVQAYAYLMVPSLNGLPRQSLRRLQAIQEFTELGSGFNLAMRDLEIRGAGNLLGPEQSGFILEMGIEMYQRIVEEAVEELREQEFKELFENQTEEIPQKRIETQVEADVEALIPDFYVESDAERLAIYRRLYKVESIRELEELAAELQDRFGEYPEEVGNLFSMVKLKVLGAQIGFTKVQLSGGKLTIIFPPSSAGFFYDALNGKISRCQHIMEAIQRPMVEKPHLRQKDNELFLIANLPSQKGDVKRLSEAERFINSIAQFN